MVAASKIGFGRNVRRGALCVGHENIQLVAPKWADTDIVASAEKGGMCIGGNAN